MVGRSDKGEFNPTFKGTDWSRDFCEGNSWHWSFCVFHDPQGLIDLMGGKKEFNHMMDSVFKMPSRLGMDSRGMIHEMREMQVMNMGQYAHGNQPIQHMVYLYNYSGEPWKAQYWVRGSCISSIPLRRMVIAAMRITDRLPHGMYSLP